MEPVLNEALIEYESRLRLKAVKIKLSFSQQIVKEHEHVRDTTLLCLKMSYGIIEMAKRNVITSTVRIDTDYSINVCVCRTGLYYTRISHRIRIMSSGYVVARSFFYAENFEAHFDLTKY